MIRFENVSKKFTMRYEDSHTLQGMFVNVLSKASPSAAGPTRPATVKILDGVSFDVARGESLGIIGPNGAGKSTILKMAAGIIHPDSGRISIGGKVAGLLELGAGFHPDLTGHENIFLYGSIIGLNRKAIEARLEEIVEFSGLSHFIDVPVRDYSSGMFMRLAFSVAIHVDAEILLIDEVLSVGDAAFRQKNHQRLLDFQKGGGTILLVSHELGAIDRLCGRVLLLENGHVVAEGPPRAVIERYLQGDTLPRQNQQAARAQEAESPMRIKAVRLFDAHGVACDKFDSGAPALLRIWFEASSVLSNPVIRVQVFHAGSLGVNPGTMAHGTNSARHSLALGTLSGTTCVAVAYESLNLVPGSYYFVVTLLPHELAAGHYDVWRLASPFEVTGSQELGAGLALLPHRWQRVDE